MRLSWNEVLDRAAAFADEWRDAAYEKGETLSFYNAFFDVFGVRRRSVTRYDAHVAKLDNRSGFIDLLRTKCLVHKAALGRKRTNSSHTMAKEEPMRRRRRGSRLARGD